MENKKVKVGVVGVGRGTSMMRYCECSGNAEIVAICDNWEQGLKDKLAELDDKIRSRLSAWRFRTAQEPAVWANEAVYAVSK